MIASTIYEYRGKMPFKNVYFTGIVRDKLGRKCQVIEILDPLCSLSSNTVLMVCVWNIDGGACPTFLRALCEQGRNFNNKYGMLSVWSKDGRLIQLSNSEAAAHSCEWFKMQLDKTIAEMDDLFGQIPFEWSNDGCLQTLFGMILIILTLLRNG